MILEFQDKVVSYHTFIQDVSAQLAYFLETDKKDPEYVSTRKAYSMFGRKNVERWVRNKLITPYVRPGVTEYETAKLRKLQRTEQDYLNE